MIMSLTSPDIDSEEVGMPLDAILAQRMGAVSRERGSDDACKSFVGLRVFLASLLPALLDRGASRRRLSNLPPETRLKEIRLLGLKIA
jgi:hypothetical protein